MAQWLRGALIVALAVSAPAGAATLEIHVQVPEPDRGSLYVALFDDAESFPEPGRALVREVREVAGGEMRLVISDLDPGEYAVAAFQDLDGSEDLTTNFLGIPQEPAGFSRGAMGVMGPPDFTDAALTLDASGGEATLDLTEPGSER
ncbi:MAG: DUF2141 domain-containing protein [Halorhodospira sp.]